MLLGVLECELPELKEGRRLLVGRVIALDWGGCAGLCHGRRGAQAWECVENAGGGAVAGVCVCGIMRFVWENGRERT